MDDEDLYIGGGLGFSNKKKKSKNSQIYGVFAADDDDDDPADSRPSFGSSSRSSTMFDFAKPMNFVSGGVVDATNQQKPLEKPSSTGESKPKRRKTKEAPPPPEDVGSWERNTKGIGSKLLKMMGWTEGAGLGKDGKGISVPIEAVKRGVREGLSEGEYMGVSKKAWRPDEVPDEEGNDEEEEEEEEEDKYEPAWKKGQQRKKVSYKLASETSTTAAEAPKQIIVDMRGPSVRVVKGFDELNKGSSQAITVTKPKFMPQLQHNINHLTDLKANRIHAAEMKKRRSEQVLTSLKKDKKTLASHIEIEAAAIQRLKNVIDMVTGCVEQFKKNNPSLTLDAMSDLFKVLAHKYQPEYRNYHLEALSYHIVFPLIKRKLRDWNPLSHPEYGVSILKQWRPFFAKEVAVDDDDLPEDEFGIAAHRRARQAARDVSSDLYNRLLFEVVLPKFRTTISSDWNPRDPDQIIQLLANWSEVLPTEFHDLILDQIVLARLRLAIEEWDPRSDSVPIHIWLHPWLPVFEQRLEVLYDTLVKKLASALQKWNPMDSSALDIMKPWKGILSARTWETLMLRTIVPKLLDGMKTFQINPANQDLTMFRSVLTWLEYIPADHIVLLLDAQFFSKWLHTLQLWLSRSPNYDEVTQWYMAWKKLFPQTLLQHERVQSRFAAALKMLDQAATKPGSITAPGNFVPPPDPVFRPITAAPTQPKAAGRESPAAAGTRQQLSSDSVSFREVVERAAEEHDLLLLPTKKSHEGKPVFMLGNATVFLEKEVVFCWKDGGWRPVSLDQLLEEQAARAKKNQGAGR